MKLSKKELDLIKSECKHYENSRSASIEALKIVQKSRGWISDKLILLIAQALCISASEVEGVATFYNQIFRQPVGQHIVRYCDSIVCYLTGCEEIQRALKNILKIDPGNTTEDNKFTLLPTCCLGMCNEAPVIMIDENIHSNVIPDKVDSIIKLY